MKNVWLKRVLRALAFFLGTYAVWFLAHAAFGATPAKPLWTKADLPPTPPTSDNGWTSAHELDVPHPSPDLVHDVLGVEDELAAAKTHAADIDALLAKAKLDEILAAITKPRFADDCSLEVDARCKTVPWMETHRVLLLAALRRPELISKIVHADIDAAQSSRTAISHMVALSALEEGLETALSLVGEESVAKADLKADLDRLDLQKLDGRRFVIAEYLLVGRPNPNLVRDGGARYLPYDEGRTDIEIDRRAKTAYDAAVAGKIPPEPPPMSTFWWVWNPKGQLLIEAVRLDYAQLFEKVQRSSKEIDQLRTKIRAKS